MESHSLFLLANSVRRVEGCRADVAEAQVSSARVIQAFDMLTNSLASLVACREGRAPDQPGFDGLEHGLDHGVVVACAVPAYRRHEAMIAQHTSVGPARRRARLF
jgi:hypothetical protein